MLIGFFVFSLLISLWWLMMLWMLVLFMLVGSLVGLLVFMIMIGVFLVSLFSSVGLLRF